MSHSVQIASSTDVQKHFVTNRLDVSNVQEIIPQQHALERLDPIVQNVYRAVETILQITKGVSYTNK